MQKRMSMLGRLALVLGPLGRGVSSAQHRHHHPCRWLVLLVTATAVAGISCSSKAATSKPTTTVLLPDQGTLYVGAGPTVFAQDLYWIRADGRSRPERITALPAGRNLSVLTAGSGQVILSEGSEGTDKIARLVGKHLERLIDDRVFTPSLSDDGRLAYSRLHEAVGQPNEFLVVVRDLASGEERTAYQQAGKSISGPAWLPQGLLAVVEKDLPGHRQTRIVLIAADGSIRRVELGERASTGLVGSPQAAHLVVADDNSPPSGFLLDLESGQRHPLPPGWLPLTWSPDGKSLLVANGRRLGLIQPPDLARVDEVGTFLAPVWQADWVVAEAGVSMTGWPK